MSEMVERVARAICESEKMNPDDKLGGWIHWVNAARAAIEAMREPTDEMLSAMEPWSRVTGHHKLVWGAGVDAALGKGPNK